MIKTRHEYLNKLLAIIDSCTTDMRLKLISTWNESDYDDKNSKFLKIKPYLNPKREIIIHLKQKKEVLNTLAECFDDSDYYHYEIRLEEKIIGKGYDSCLINFLNPNYFIINKGHIEVLDDSEIVLTEQVEEN